MIENLAGIAAAPMETVGNKSRAVAILEKKGMPVPATLCVTTAAYDAYLDATGLRERIMLELSRRPLDSMRWEEMWDAALRIRNFFLRFQMPDALRESLVGPVSDVFDGCAVVVRSSAPGEDAAGSSFAGLHDSFVNVRGTDSILKHIRLVWASLWSDAAILYRRELGLDVTASRMAVLVQELVAGRSSGVAFVENPVDGTQSVIESVHGLNQGLVDGDVEPDRWILERETGAILEHRAPVRERMAVPSDDGVDFVFLDEDRSARSPLSGDDVHRVWTLVNEASEVFGCPQDMEWTLAGKRLVVLQSRAITSRPADGEKDGKAWYLGLRRSVENLKALRRRIEDEILPGMDADAERLSLRAVHDLSERDLRAEYEERCGVYRRWKQVYWDECIPMAHGMRLFGQFYNDELSPDDPHAFMALLTAGDLFGLDRNDRLMRLAEKWSGQAEYCMQLRKSGAAALSPEDREELRVLAEEFGGSVAQLGLNGAPMDTLLAIILRFAESGGDARGGMERKKDDIRKQEARFLEHFRGDRRLFAEDLLELGRASYRLRDNDNIVLGRIEATIQAVVSEARTRLVDADRPPPPGTAPSDIMRMLIEPGYSPGEQELEAVVPVESGVRLRQLTGQPAGPGLAEGFARVVTNRSDVMKLEKGEILVCDAIDPNMTLVVPLAAAIVERRGGMLIHGAIIAREYGLPCVTGVENATVSIPNGARVSVDGYLGIVRVCE